MARGAITVRSDSAPPRPVPPGCEGQIHAANAIDQVAAQDCHAANADSSGSWDAFADETPLKRTTRRMVAMVNALNKANYNTPSTSYQSPTTFGIITSAKTMRQLQLSLKYSF